MSTEKQLEWIHTPLGQYIQAEETAFFNGSVSNIFGFNAMQVGLLEMDCLRNSRMPQLIRVDEAEGIILCEAAQLPLASSCIDLLVLPHALEFSEQPHQVLREAERVLVPEGHIIISGFNPFSAWGMRRVLSRQHDYPWDGNFLSLLRIKDWLALLGFEVVQTSTQCFVPPFSKPGWLKRFDFMDKSGRRWWPMMGGVYFVIAKKRVAGMRLIKPNWKKSSLKPGFISVSSQKTDHQKKQYEQ